MKRKVLFLAVVSVFADSALAQVVLPSGTSPDISVSGSKMTVNQGLAQRKIYDWTSFNITGTDALGNRGEVQFVQPGATAIALNRIAGGMSTIDGKLTANGHIILLNQNGILFGANAIVNVGSLTASTGKLSVEDDVFQNPANAAAAVRIIEARTGKIENLGRITVADAGLVAFVAPSVINSGTIRAVGGRIRLAGAEEATVSLNGGLFEMVVDKGGANSKVENLAGGTLTTVSETAVPSDPVTGTIILSARDALNVVSGVINLSGVQQASLIEVHGGVVNLKSDLNAATVTGTSATVNVSDSGKLQDAVDIAKVGAPGAGAAVNVNGGTYDEQITLNKANMTFAGNSGAKIRVPDGAQVNGVAIAANNVTVSGFEIAGPVTSSYLTYPWGSNISRGIVVANGVTGFNIFNNNIHDIRTGILIDGRNTGSVTGNTIDNTKSAISVQYTDASGITISGNQETTSLSNEWGLNLHLNGYLVGGNPTSNPANPVAPTLAWQQALLDFSTTNDGWAVQDQYYKTANRTHVTVATTGSDNNQGSALTPLQTIKGGINAVVPGGYVNVKGGTYLQSATLEITKPLTLRGAGQGVTFIDSHGVSGYGMFVTGDKVTLSDFTIYGPLSTTGDPSNAYGIKVSPPSCSPTPSCTASQRLHDFHISYVTSQGAGRAELDLNGVIGATIDHFTADGMSVATGVWTKGAGIQITDSKDVTITNSTTDHNLWGGVALYQSNRFFDQQVTGITIDVTQASGNHFNEKNPLYLQDESATKNFDFGTIHLAGFGYVVRNPTTVTTPAGTADQSQYLWMQRTAPDAFNYAVGAHDLYTDPRSVGVQNTYASYVQGWTGTALTQDFYVGVGTASPGVTQAMKIQAAIDVANMGAMINVFPGIYTESVTTRTSQGVQVDAAGLFVDKDGLTLRGVDSDGHAITSADNVQAWITAGARSNFGMAHGVVANDVTFEGLGFKPKTDYLNKTIEISGNNFTFANSVVDNRFESTPGGTQAGGAGALYFGELDKAGHQITRLTVTGSKFLDGSIVITEGVGASADGLTFQPAADRVISNNVFVGSSNYRFGAVLLNGYMEEINWRTKPIGAVTLTGNRFSGFDDSVMMRGEQQGVDLKQVMRDNTFDRSVLVTDAGGNVRGEEYVSTMGGPLDLIRMQNKYSIQSSIQAGIARSAAGDTVNVGSEATAEIVVLNSARNLSFNGSTIGSLTINAANAGIGGRVTASGSGGFLFNAPVSLLADTSLATTGANITFAGHIQTAGGSPYALSLNAGGGDVSMVSGGTQGNPLGHFNVLADDFNLASTLWVSGYDINAAGNVSLADHTLNSIGALLSLISAGGNVTGSTTSQGSVQIAGGGDVTTNIISLGNVEIVATNVGGNITGAFIVIGAENNVNANVNSVQVVEITSGGAVNVSGTAQSLVLNAPVANASGDFGEVVNSGGGAVIVNGRPQPTVRVVEVSTQKLVPTTVVTAADSEAGPATPADSTKPTLKPTLKLLTAEAKEAQPSGLSNAAELLRRGQSVEIDLTPGNN